MTRPLPTLPAPAAPAHPLRLLVVEDSDGNREALCRLLGKHLGHAPIGVPSVNDALDVISAGFPDGALVDLMLGDGSGETVLDALPGIPTLVMSGTTDDDAIARVRARDGCEFMPKPVKFLDVRSWVEAVERTVRR